jgi:transcriptional regulator with XRE-family HTH domain
LGETQHAFAARLLLRQTSSVSKYEQGKISPCYASLLILRSLATEEERAVIDQALAGYPVLEQVSSAEFTVSTPPPPPSFLRLEAFLYVLLRDHLPAGAVESIVCDHAEKITGAIEFSNKQLGAYAHQLARRLTKGVAR